MGRRRDNGFATSTAVPPPMGGLALTYRGRPKTCNFTISWCMDASGARLLAARIAAGVRVGSRIELLSASNADLRVGDVGVVCGIESGGDVVVEWERGFNSSINPRNTAFRALAR